MHLNTLKPGQQAVVSAIKAEQALYQRLTALGFRPGKRLCVMRQAAFNGPLHIRIGTTDVMIRPHDAACILLHPDQLETISA
jgi:ferrous iron transport protein A